MDRLIQEADRVLASPLQVDNIRIAERLAYLVEGLRLAQPHLNPMIHETEKAAVDIRVRHLSSRIAFSLFRDWFGPFYQTWGPLKGDPTKPFFAMQEAVVFRATMLGEPSGIQLQGSLLQTFDLRVRQTPPALGEIIGSKLDSSVKVPAVYLALNTYRLLHTYETTLGAKVTDAKTMYQDVLANAQDIIKADRNLSAFYYTACVKDGLQCREADYFQNVFLALQPSGNIRRDCFIARNALELQLWSVFDAFASQLDSASTFELEPHGSLVFPVLAVRRIRMGAIPETLKLGLLPPFVPANTEEAMKILFPRTSPQKISQTHRDKLAQMDDKGLRSAICSIISQSTFLSNEERDRVLEESKKPHTGAEIGDVDVFYKEKIGERHLASLALKSNSEMRGQPVGEKFIHQLTRPFGQLGSASVVAFLISATRASINLDNQIKLLKLRYNFPIRFIGPEELIAILVSYGEL